MFFFSSGYSSELMQEHFRKHSCWSIVCSHMPVFLKKKRQRCNIIGLPDHVYFVHPSTNISVDISTDISVECRSTYRPIYRLRCVSRHINRHINRDIGRYLDRYVDRELLSNSRPTCRLIGYRHSADTSLLLAYW